MLDVLEIELFENHNINDVFGEMSKLSCKLSHSTASLIGMADEEGVNKWLGIVICLDLLDNMLNLLVYYWQQHGQLYSTHLVVPNNHVL